MTGADKVKAAVLLGRALESADAEKTRCYLLGIMDLLAGSETADVQGWDLQGRPMT